MTRLFIAIVNMSITASYVALAVIAIRLLLGKLPKIFAYTLWAAVWMRLVCPFSFPSSFSVLNLLQPIAQSNQGAMAYIPPAIGLMQSPAVDVGIPGANQLLNSSLPAATPTASVNPMQLLTDMAAAIWLAGVAAFLLYSIISYASVSRHIRTATLIRDNIFETERIETPFVCGFIKPRIYVPTDLSPTELSYVWAHEETHIRRWDYLVKPFAYAVLIMHWFNPLVWLCFAFMSKDMEMSCDESVIKKIGKEGKAAYLNSLLSLAVKRSGIGPGSPLAFGESHIQARIKNILSYRKPPLWVLIPAAVATAALLTAFTANPKQEQWAGEDALHFAASEDTLRTLIDGPNRAPFGAGALGKPRFRSG